MLRFLCIVMGLWVALKLAAATSALTLAESGRATATILIAAGATTSEQMAAQEVAEYLRQITGGTFRVQPEEPTPAEGSRVFVGPTVFARSQGLTADKLGPEE